MTKTAAINSDINHWSISPKTALDAPARNAADPRMPLAMT
jgi:hypothetical protein